jgi:hypothetical protein
VISSPDGSQLAAAADEDEGDGLIYISTNAGAAWRPTTAPRDFWTALTATPDGRTLAAGSFDDGIYISTNGGATWQQKEADSTVIPLAMSPDGTHLAATDSYEIDTSDDGGSTWVQTNAPVDSWRALASDKMGFVVLAGADEAGPIYFLGTGAAGLQPTAPPELSIASHGLGLTVSWTLPSSRFVLQESSVLAPTHWMDVATGPTLNFTNLNYETAVAPSGRSHFYRLRSQ